MNLYGIGIGPGDPELITLKALKMIRKVDAIVVPVSSLKLTYNAVKPYLGGKEVIEFNLPVRRDRSEYRKLADSISSYREVAYVTLGDPAFYSSLYRLSEHVSVAEVVPGISSFSWCSALHKIPIGLGDEKVLISPGNLDGSYKADTFVFMKGETEAPIKCGNGYFTVSIKRSAQSRNG
ncbi:MAG: precorrin-2 C(20)-methyltransferase [Metallosphaera sp.]|uniref:Uroporphyrin-III C/tetrapyrrole methyltransferase n=1 Tax=Metallosphaera cuprina (strain Ar-4) TaxID=1006006 RepID=F4FYL6_METCR|nr:precorrin-2 C(20)-methyltransferase [Metallosphaera cuprina]AEB95514.1 uroporphyrin-III C/tetrapyrrole methyltransferase [Metallosphaera cuprina Ar-4]